MCFSKSAEIKANTIPMPADAKNIVKNVLKAEAMASPVSESGIRDTVVVSTIAIASKNLECKEISLKLELIMSLQDFM